MVIQLYWIRQLFALKPAGYQSIQAAGATQSERTGFGKQQAADEAAEVAIKYAPIYAIGNLCIGQ